MAVDHRRPSDRLLPPVTSYEPPLRGVQFPMDPCVGVVTAAVMTWQGRAENFGFLDQIIGFVGFSRGSNSNFPRNLALNT